LHKQLTENGGKKIKTNLNNENLSELISLVESRIFFIDEQLLPDEVIFKAKKMVADVDFDDFAFVATAFHIDAWL